MEVHGRRLTWDVGRDGESMTLSLSNRQEVPAEYGVSREIASFRSGPQTQRAADHLPEHPAHDAFRASWNRLIFVARQGCKARREKKLLHGHARECKLVCEVPVAASAKERGFPVYRMDDEHASRAQDAECLIDERHDFVFPKVLDHVEGDNDILGTVAQSSERWHQIALAHIYSKSSRQMDLLYGRVNAGNITVPRKPREMQQHAVSAAKIHDLGVPVLWEALSDELFHVGRARPKTIKRDLSSFVPRGYVVAENALSIAHKKNYGLNRGN